MEHAVHRFDLLLLDAILLTADPARPEIREGALGIAQGRITWLDSRPPPHYEARRTLRLPGCFVTPGLVNVHLHSILTMVRGVAADLGFAPSYTPGIPKGTQVNLAQARALARLGALEAMLFGSTLVGDNFTHADVTTEAMAELGLRLCPSWRIHDVDFAQVAHGRWSYDAAIGRRTLEAGLALHERWQGHPRVKVNLAAHAVDTCSDAFLREIAAADQSETRAKTLQHQRDRVGEHQHPQQRIAEARAALEIGRPVARVHVTDRHHEARPHERQHALPSANRAVRLRDRYA